VSSRLCSVCIVLGAFLLGARLQDVATRPAERPPRYAIRLPPPVTIEDIAWFGDMLSLSEAQRMVVSQLYGTYAGDYALIRSQIEPDLTAAATKAAAPEASLETDYIPFAAFQKECIERLISLDASLFDSIANLLSEPQREVLFSRVFWQRKRDRSSLFASQIPGSQVDMARLASAMLAERCNDPAIVDILMVYDAGATALFEARLWATLDGVTEGHILFERAKRGELAPDEFTRTYQDALSGRVRLGRQILQTNLECLSRLASVVPADIAAQLEDRFQAAAFRLIFPDPYDARPLIRVMRAQAGAERRRDKQFLDACDAYEARRASINQDMIARYIGWHEDFLSTMTKPDERTSKYLSEMDRLERARRENLVTLLDVIVPPRDAAMDERARAALDHCRTALAAPMRSVGPDFGFSSPNRLTSPASPPPFSR
jgi:hypothetical protein